MNNVISNFYNYDFIIFDFDGVILDSNELKNLAFKEIFKNFSENKIKDFIKYCKKNGSVSRYIKIDYFLKKNLIKYNKSIMKIYLDEFSNILKEKLIKAKYVPGVKKFIRCLRVKKIPLFVISGSDQKELVKLIYDRKINNFIKVYGSPLNKYENFKLLLNECKKKNIDHNKVLAIGDSKIDFLLAKKNKLDFLYIYQFSEWTDSKKDLLLYNNHSKIYNFNNLNYEK